LTKSVDDYLVDFVHILVHSILLQRMATFTEVCRNLVFMAQSNRMLASSSCSFAVHTEFSIANSAGCFIKDSLLFFSLFLQFFCAVILPSPINLHSIQFILQLCNCFSTEKVS